jgi:hypothetical protein
MDTKQSPPEEHKLTLFFSAPCHMATLVLYQPFYDPQFSSCVNSRKVLPSYNAAAFYD